MLKSTKNHSKNITQTTAKLLLKQSNNIKTVKKRITSIKNTLFNIHIWSLLITKRNSTKNVAIKKLKLVKKKANWKKKIKKKKLKIRKKKRFIKCYKRYCDLLCLNKCSFFQIHWFKYIKNSNQRQCQNTHKNIELFNCLTTRYKSIILYNSRSNYAHRL